jgi:hypothetical protein
VASGDDHAAVAARHYHLVVAEVINFMALVALAHRPCGLRLLH